MTAKPIFIVGCPRSGTTLLRNLLRSHSRLTFPEESHFIPAYYRRYGNPSSEQQALHLAADILSLAYVREWALDLTPQDFAACRTFAGVLEVLYGAWARKEGKPRWGDKTPQYGLHLDVLLELFPEGKIIHVIRDGRDVALSWLRIGFGPNNTYRAAVEWKEFVTKTCAAGRQLSPDRYKEVHFEELLSKPEDTMRSVCEFIEEAYEPSILTPNPLPESRARRYNYSPNPALPADQLEGRRRRLLPSGAGGWKEHMKPGDQALFSSVAGDLLVDLGYSVTQAPRKVTVLQRGWWTLHHALLWIWVRLTSRNKRTWLWTDLKLRAARLLANSVNKDADAKTQRREGG